MERIFPPCGNSACAKPSESYCSACHSTGYCSVACQRAAWPSHKVACAAVHHLRYVQLANGDLIATAVARGIKMPAVVGEAGFIDAAARETLIAALMATDKKAKALKAPRSGPPARRARDWTITVPGMHPRLSRDGRACLRLLIIGTPLGRAMACNDLVEPVRHMVGLTRSPGRPLDSPEMVSELLETARLDVHALYVVDLNGCEYQLLLETRAGAARVWQCFIDQGPGEGFTAADWAAAEPQPHWAPSIRKAHAARGGSRELGELELEALLLLLLDLHRAALVLGKVLFDSLPAKAIADEAAYVARLKAGSPGPVVNDGPLERLIIPIISSPAYPSNISFVVNLSRLDVFTNYTCNGPPLRVSAPMSVAGPFMERFMELTGHCPSPSVFLKILRHSNFDILHESQKIFLWGFAQGITLE